MTRDAAEAVVRAALLDEVTRLERDLRALAARGQRALEEAEPGRWRLVPRADKLAGDVARPTFDRTVEFSLVDLRAHEEACDSFNGTGGKACTCEELRAMPVDDPEDCFPPASWGRR